MIARDESFGGTVIRLDALSARIRKLGSWPALALAAAIASIDIVAAVPAAAQYSIGWYTVDGGGITQSNGGLYTLGGTTGQPDAGVMSGGVYTLKGGFWLGGVAVADVEDGIDATPPASFRLHPAYPNPLMRRSTIAFELPNERFVQLRVYDASGRLARTLAAGSFPPGRHQRTWDGVDDHGQRVAAGVYFVRIDTETDRETMRIAVLR